MAGIKWPLSMTVLAVMTVAAALLATASPLETIQCECAPFRNATSQRVECNLRVSWSSVLPYTRYWIGVYPGSTQLFPRSGSSCPRHLGSPLSFFPTSSSGSSSVSAKLVDLVENGSFKCVLWRGTPPGVDCRSLVTHNTFTFSAGPNAPSSRPPVRPSNPTPPPFKPVNPSPPRRNSSNIATIMPVIVIAVIGFFSCIAFMIYAQKRKRERELQADGYSPANDSIELSDASAPQVAFTPSPQPFTLASPNPQVMMMTTPSGVPMPPQYLVTNNPYAPVQMVYTVPQQGYMPGQPVYFTTNPGGFYPQMPPQETTQQ